MKVLNHRGQRLHRIPRRRRLRRRRARGLGPAPPGGAPLPARYGHVTGNLAEPGALTAAAASYDRSSTPAPPSTTAPTAPGRRRCSPPAAAALHPPAPPSSAPAPKTRTARPPRTPSRPAGPPSSGACSAPAAGVIRPGMVYGDGGGLVHGLLTTKAAERGTGVYIGPPGTRWPVVHIDDLAALYLAVATRAAPGTIWHGGQRDRPPRRDRNRTRPRPSRELAGVRGPRRTRPAGRTCSPATRTSQPQRPAPRWAGHPPAPPSSRTSPPDHGTVTAHRQETTIVPAERQGTRPGSCTRACAGLRLS